MDVAKILFQRINNFSVGLVWIANTTILSFNPGSYTFLADHEQYTFYASDLQADSKVRGIPQVLDWAIGSRTCEEAQKIQPLIPARRTATVTIQTTIRDIVALAVKVTWETPTLVLAAK
ncbi:hypothetical protein MKW92_012119, partial [Papaver armeniacum]